MGGHAESDEPPVTRPPSIKNVVGGMQSGIASGGDNSIGRNSNFCNIGGGSNNRIPTAMYGVVSGGYGNSVNKDLGVVVGGNSNHASAQYASILGGQSNVIEEDAEWGFVGSGRSNAVSGLYSIVVGGDYSEVRLSPSPGAPRASCHPRESAEPSAAPPRRQEITPSSPAAPSTTPPGASRSSAAAPRTGPPTPSPPWPGER